MSKPRARGEVSSRPARNRRPPPGYPAKHAPGGEAHGPAQQVERSRHQAHQAHHPPRVEEEPQVRLLDQSLQTRARDLVDLEVGPVVVELARLVHHLRVQLAEHLVDVRALERLDHEEVRRVQARGQSVVDREPHLVLGLRGEAEHEEAVAQDVQAVADADHLADLVEVEVLADLLLQAGRGGLDGVVDLVRAGCAGLDQELSSTCGRSATRWEGQRELRPQLRQLVEDRPASDRG